MANGNNLNPDPSEFARSREELNKLRDQYNKFARAEAENNASALDFARTLNAELRDSLGVKQKLNDQEKTLRNLGNEVVKAVQQNVIELGNAGKINREITKAQSLQNKLVTEITSIAGELNEQQTLYAQQLADTYSTHQDISKELQTAQDIQTEQLKLVADLESKTKSVGVYSEEELTRLQEQLKTQKNVLDDITRNVEKKQEAVNLGDELISGLQKELNLQGKIDAQTANRLAALISMKIAHQDNIAELQQEEQIQRRIEDRMGVTGALVKGTGALMERLGMRSGIFHKAMEDAQTEMQKLAEESERVDPATGKIMQNASKLQIMFKGLSELGKGFGKALFDPFTIITAIVSKAFELNAASTKLQRLTGQNAGIQAAHNSSLASGAQVMGLMAEMTERTGIAAAAMFSSEDLGRLAEAQNLLGLSAEQASNLGMFSKASGTSIQGYKEELVESVNNFNAMNDSAVAHGVVMQDVLNASADVSMSLGGNPEKLATAAAAARKLGLDLAKVNKIADDLMNFESSIESELEAQLLTGKQINLSKARELALNNDLEGLANELAKNGASAAEFANMNRIQQEAMAKALGMNREEMGKMLIAQEGQKNLSKEQRAAMRGVTLEQLEQMEASESLQLAFSKIAEPLASILNTLAPIVTMIAKAVAFVAPIAPYLLAAYGASKLLAGGFINIAASAGNLGKSLMDKGKGVMGFFTNFKSNMSSIKSGIKDFANVARGALTGKVKSKAGDLFSVLSPQGKMILTKGGTRLNPLEKLKEKATEDTKKLADSTGGVKPGAGEGPKGFLKGLGDGLASIGKQFGNVVKGALALGIAGLALGVSFALALRMVKDVDPAQMLAFAGSLTMLGLTLALLGNVGGQIIQGALAMGILGIALIPAAFAFSLLADIKPGQMFAFAGALTLLGLAAAGLGFLFPFIAAGAGAIALLGASLIPAAFAFNLLGNTPIESIIQQLTGLAMVAPQLMLVGLGLMSIAAGLGAIAIAGIMALPALAALGTFALVMTPLMALGGLFGEGGGEEEDGFARLEEKLDTLISVVSAGGDVYLDSDKVGRTQAKAFSKLVG
jgi:hypothetical protein